MAITLINPDIVINSVDLTNHITSVTFEESYADVDTTAFGATSKTRIAGLGDHKFSCEFQQDFANGSVEQTIYPLVSTLVAVTVQQNPGSVTTSNPSYSFNVLVTEWSPVAGKVGDL